jgi:hypothetical protein
LKIVRDWVAGREVGWLLALGRVRRSGEAGGPCSRHACIMSPAWRHACLMSAQACKALAVAARRPAGDVRRMYAIVAAVNLQFGSGRFGVFRCGSHLNHKCDPNAHCTYTSEGTLELRAVAPIAEGDEVTISFVSPSPEQHKVPDPELARALVNAQFGFVCKCPAHA